MSGYWKNDGDDNYHWVSYEGIGVLLVVAFVACMFFMTKVVPLFRAAEAAIFNNIIIVVIISVIETIIVALILRHKFVTDYFFNFLHFGLFIFTFAFMAKWLGSININAGFINLIGEAIEFAIRLVVSFFVFCASSIFGFGACISAQQEGIDAGDSNIVGTMIGALIQAVGMGAFILLDYFF